MTNQELYINGVRINLGLNFGVRLNRQLLNPAELNTKDAQFSYSITVPTGGINDVAFNFSAVEETRDKFNRLYTADYIVNSIRIFRGNFKLTSVTRTAYKGNLYVPAPKTIKDIFGEIKLNQNPELRIPFEDFAESINGYNVAALTEPQYAIFPYTLYGVLPKTPLNRNADSYSDRELWDASVRIGMQDLPPSINPLLMLRHIFNAQGYTLQGTAFDDERLSKLYLSYKNAADYVQPWNYGQHAKFGLNGSWASTYNMRKANPFDGREFERAVNQGQDASGVVYACDIFDSTNSKINITEDSGGNISYKEVNDASGRTFVNCQLRIPSSGFYKVDFDCQVQVYDVNAWRATDPATGVQHIGGRSANTNNDMNNCIYEFRLMRDRKTGDFSALSPRINSIFYRNNQPQNIDFDENNMPKYFPQTAGGMLNMIDLAQDRSHVLGFGWGRKGDQSEYKNPRDTSGAYSQMQAAKPALSWDTSESVENITRLAVKSLGWWKWGRIGNFDNEGDNPDANIDYSAGARVTGKELDANGNPVDVAANSLTARENGYYIDKTTGVATLAIGWNVSPFIELKEFTDLKFSGVYAPNNRGAIVAYYDDNKQFIGTGQVMPNAANLVDTNAAGIIENNSLDGGGTITPFADARITAQMPVTGGALYTYYGYPYNVAIRVEDAAGNLYASALTGGAVPYNITIPAGGVYARAMLKLQAVPQGYVFFGAGWSTQTYTNQAITPPAGAAYVRVTEWANSPATITGTAASNANIILNRFQLRRYYTYRLTAGSTYEGFAYVHNGADLTPLIVAPFVDGVAEFSTSLAPVSVFDPKLTIYLKTPDFDVDGTLVISRKIEGESVDVIDWELTDKYAIDLVNAPANAVNRGWSGDAGKSGNGQMHAVVWFEAGELISMASVSTEGRYRQNGMHSTFGMVEHRVDWSLSIQPFRTDKEWLGVDFQGNGTRQMNWNDAPNFDTDSINLVGFLNADMKTDDFIDNFCKAFNLRLSQIDLTTYALDVKQSKTAVSSRFVNLDKIANVSDRENTPLGLPSIYKLGFTVDTEEEGYVSTCDPTITDPKLFIKSGDDGGGEYETGAVEENVVEQKSTFSYNWFKEITKVEAGGDITLQLAVISKADVWADTMPYPEAMGKRYSDLAYRFWYMDGILNGTFAFNGTALQLAKVSNEMAGVSILNYKNMPYTILDNFFTVLINGSSHYTELEGYLTPAMYVQLDGSIMAMFNGDLYFIAELGAYDPTGANKTNIKLIRKI